MLIKIDSKLVPIAEKDFTFKLNINKKDKQRKIDKVMFCKNAPFK